MHAKDWFLVFISFFLPPVAVFIKRGISVDFWINILLFLLGFFPGLVHALYIISQYPEDERSTYQGATYPGAQGAPNYGAV
ncbi:YqaE/Pmp3 family membrane protein [Cyberlindnera jadinii NRRL Y-1542]|uniref:UPF0057-domain-containing protein n=1 Tax=Cyberlindnera jadinii (strain ATCC 18201 / CBS 1600 / BCRC 20928 / JCM 3617 / NBRC 0987 / NRRL Y-1542) TaxID=983966 RepID=A0A1E4S489_CYBJN|nr:UPF0057-domain-containing protein [Cyberlindnera jadinii NRRL Y-1542]ODV74324.1 UPF0057-domain-containing protein [Cyberlindnera jadinii NRRL Y-1542]